MNKLVILAAILSSGCASLDAQPGKYGDGDPTATAQAPDCRMGAVPVCTRVPGADDRPALNCECAYVPASLTGRQSFNMRSFRRRR